MRAQRKEGERLYDLAKAAYHEKQRNFQEIIRLLNLAAEQKNPDALYDLATCYRDGEGVARDFKESVRFLKLAAEQGHSSALAGLADCYEEGVGVKKDINEAEYCRRLSAEKNALVTFRGLMSSIEYEKNHPVAHPIMEKLVKEYYPDLLARLSKEEEKVCDYILRITEEKSTSESEKNILREKVEQFIEQKSLLPDQLEEKRKTWENEANTLGDALDAVEMPKDFISIIGGYAALFQTSADKDTDSHCTQQSFSTN